MSMVLRNLHGMYLEWVPFSGEWHWMASDPSHATPVYPEAAEALARWARRRGQPVSLLLDDRAPKDYPLPEEA